MGMRGPLRRLMQDQQQPPTGHQTTINSNVPTMPTPDRVADAWQDPQSAFYTALSKNCEEMKHLAYLAASNSLQRAAQDQPQDHEVLQRELKKREAYALANIKAAVRQAADAALNAPGAQAKHPGSVVGDVWDAVEKTLDNIQDAVNTSAGAKKWVVPPDEVAEKWVVPSEEVDKAQQQEPQPQTLNPNPFAPPPSSGGSLSAGAIAGIVIGCVVTVALLAVLVWVLLRRRSQEQSQVEDGSTAKDAPAPSVPIVTVAAA